MEVTVALLAVAVTLILGWLAKRKYWEHTALRRHGISGPKPDLFMGNYAQLKKDRVGVLTQWVKEYGKHFGFYYGRQPIIVCSDLDTIRQILIKESANFIDRADPPMSVEPFRSSIIYLKGEEWKKIRCALTPAFSAAKMRLMCPIMQDSVDTFVDILKSKAKSGETFDINRVIQGLTLDVISKCALAMDCDCQRNVGGLRKQVAKFFEEAENELVNLAWSFPFLRYIFVILYKLFATGGIIKSIMSNLEHVILRRRSGQGPKKMDMLQLMLDAQKATNSQVVTDVHVKANAFISLVAGFETTANTLAFTSHILVDRPDIQKQIMEEIQQQFPDKLAKKEKLSYEDLQQLKYLDQVVSESLRVYPPIVLFVTRNCARTCTINGYEFLAGAHVMIPVYQLHHDPELWDSPEEIRPERFAPDAKDAIHPAQYLPFGLGPRMCIGMRFALLEVKMALVEMLRNIRLKPGEGFESPPKLVVPSVMINPKNGVKVRVELV